MYGQTDNKVVNTDLVDNQTIFPLELNTMPGAGSSFYWMLYGCTKRRICSKEALGIGKLTVYIGGNEHATGHLLYLFGINS
jgi:leucyl-tRNA synthetase